MKKKILPVRKLGRRSFCYGRKERNAALSFGTETGSDADALRGGITCKEIKEALRICDQDRVMKWQPTDVRVVANHPSQLNIVYTDALQGGAYRPPAKMEIYLI